ncbi:MAG: hypothetical protein JXA57_17670 [Armatimonadetes bacterium]|nr:hypothetical protein [Armatimonadota bacterium]
MGFFIPAPEYTKIDVALSAKPATTVSEVAVWTPSVEEVAGTVATVDEVAGSVLTVADVTGCESSIPDPQAEKQPHAASRQMIAEKNSTLRLLFTESPSLGQ